MTKKNKTIIKYYCNHTSKDPCEHYNQRTYFCEFKNMSLHGHNDFCKNLITQIHRLASELDKKVKQLNKIEFIDD